MFHRMLSGATVHRAPENDQGHEADDLDEDFSLDEEPDEDEVDDDPDLDADLDEVDDDSQDEPPARQPSRGENRVAAATRTAAEAKAKAESLERELAELRAQANRQNQAPQETATQRQQRLEAMEPWERTEALRQESERRMEAQIAQMRWESNEASDKAAYEALCAKHPVAEKLKGEVEQHLAEIRKAGTTAPRETVLRWVIGDRALANKGKATGRAQKSANANRDRQTTRAASGRGDAAPEGRRGGDSSKRDKRLENYQL